MRDISPTTMAGATGLQALLAEPAAALAAFDYDGTLSPIVQDPAQARALPGVVAALADLSQRLGHVAIITGRPVAAVVSLLGLSEVAGLDDLVVLGQYGLERWDSARREVVSPEPPPGVDMVRREIAHVLDAAGVLDASLEDKGLAIAVHVRRSAEPQEALDRMRAPLLALADRAGLAAEPGRFVIELRPRGMDKGQALLGLADEVGARTLMFTGDDLGDLAAYDAVDSWRAGGRPGLLVCSASEEVRELAARADILVDGPAGVLGLVRNLVTLLPR